MTTWTSILTIANLVVAIGIIIGGYIAIRSSMGRASSEIQERIRQALHDENELLQARVKRLETENKRLNKLVLLVVNVLKKTHGITLEINEDMITLRDASGLHISHLYTTDDLGA